MVRTKTILAVIMKTITLQIGSILGIRVYSEVVVRAMKWATSVASNATDTRTTI